MDEAVKDSNFPWSLGIFDAHCHPTDTLSSLPSLPTMRAGVLTIMATRAQDQQLVAGAADEYGVTLEDTDDPDSLTRSTTHKVIPSFGWHPWFSYQMFFESDYSGASTLTPEQKKSHYTTVLTPTPTDEVFLSSLPEPIPFEHFLSQTHSYLQEYPVALIGEIGLDRSFRIPIPEPLIPSHAEQRDSTLTPGGREGRKLSPYKVDMAHQRRILQAQLRLAGEMHRAVSVHGVQAAGIVYETLAECWRGWEREVLSKKEKKRMAVDAGRRAGWEEGNNDGSGNAKAKPFPPRICLHSYSGAAETVKQYVAPSVPCEVFFSFSTTINAWKADAESGDGEGEIGKVEAAVKAVPADRVLVESDMHIAGEEMDQQLEMAVRKICAVKGWKLRAGVTQLGQNWRRFVFGREGAGTETVKDADNTH